MRNGDIRMEKYSEHEKEWLQHHYNMWNEIVEALKEDSSIDINIVKRQYIQQHNLENAAVTCNCFLCDLYACSKCPLYYKQGGACVSVQPYNLYAIAADRDTKYSRVDAAEEIRDCVIN